MKRRIFSILLSVLSLSLLLLPASASTAAHLQTATRPTIPCGSAATVIRTSPITPTSSYEVWHIDFDAQGEGRMIGATIPYYVWSDAQVNSPSGTTHYTIDITTPYLPIVPTQVQLDANAASCSTYNGPLNITNVVISHTP